MSPESFLRLVIEHSALYLEEIKKGSDEGRERYSEIVAHLQDVPFADLIELEVAVGMLNALVSTVVRNHFAGQFEGEKGAL